MITSLLILYSNYIHTKKDSPKIPNNAPQNFCSIPSISYLGRGTNAIQKSSQKS